MVVITGGPCAGKTSALSELRGRLGDGVEFIPEAATDLILQGIAPWTCASALEFQTRVIALQLEREAAVMAASGDGALVICDRGVPDSRAYLSADEYACALEANGLTAAKALERYDAVIHLESVAKANPAAYTCSNNEARFENAAEAADADDRTYSAWSGHPHLVRIPFASDFNAKMEQLAAVIMQAV